MYEDSFPPSFHLSAAYEKVHLGHASL